MKMCCLKKILNQRGNQNHRLKNDLERKMWTINIQTQWYVFKSGKICMALEAFIKSKKNDER